MTSLRQARWDDADLEARLCRTLTIAARVVDHFAVSGYVDAESPEYSFGPDKALSETAMLLYAASGARHLDEVARWIDAIAQLLIPHARSERVLLDMTLHPTLCLHFAVPHILLTQLGYGDAGFDALLAACLRSQAHHGLERPPFASVEQRWLASLWTGVGPGREWRDDLRRSVLYRPLDILGGVREDGYALTHLLMYCTDFGFRRGRLPRRRAVILGEASSLLAKCLDAEDYDLAGEVLLTWPFTGARWSAAATFGFRVLTRIEDQIGVLPGGTTKAERLQRLDGCARTRYALGTAYHTAYVMGFLCAAALRPGRAPALKLRGRPRTEAFVDRLQPYLEYDQGHWQAAWVELTAAERNTLAPLLLDIALAQQCRKRAYEAVYDLLVFASDHDMARSPLCAQATALLQRLAAYSHAIHLKRLRSVSERSSLDAHG